VYKNSFNYLEKTVFVSRQKYVVQNLWFPRRASALQNTEQKNLIKISILAFTTLTIAIAVVFSKVGDTFINTIYFTIGIKIFTPSITLCSFKYSMGKNDQNTYEQCVNPVR
jgi:hypothetical protein